jgi:regulator of cell morphogenesis and NO signaling
MNDITKESAPVPARTVGEIVAEDYRTAEVFEKYRIDFCCGGKVTVEAACRERGIDPGLLVREIEAAQREPVARGENYASWTLAFLADYIVNTHHAWLRENTGQTAAYARKIAEVHGGRHPEAIEVAKIFDRVAADMSDHLRAEEEVFFPAVKRLEAARREGTVPSQQDRQLLATSLGNLHHEHEEIGAAVHTIRALAQGYAIPGDVCTTYAVTFQRLREFEEDLHKHVHLENNILFPKAAGL